MGDIFKSDASLAAVAKDANKIATYFTSKLHTYFIGKLRDEQMEQYQKFVNLIPPGDTRWNSYFYCFASIINTKEALKVTFVF